MIGKIREIASEVMEQNGLSWEMENCTEEFRESARYFFEKEDGSEYQVSLNVTDDGEDNIEWSFYEREGEDWYTVDSDIVELD